jgi:hypothetical protein
VLSARTRPQSERFLDFGDGAPTSSGFNTSVISPSTSGSSSPRPSSTSRHHALDSGSDDENGSDSHQLIQTFWIFHPDAYSPAPESTVKYGTGERTFSGCSSCSPEREQARSQVHVVDADRTSQCNGPKSRALAWDTGPRRAQARMLRAMDGYAAGRGRLVRNPSPASSASSSTRCLQKYPTQPQWPAASSLAVARIHAHNIIRIYYN